MSTRNAQKVSLTGLNPSFANVDDEGDQFANSGREVVHLKNTSLAALDVTIASAADCNQGFTHNVVVSVPAEGERLVGPFPKTRFDDEGFVKLSYEEHSEGDLKIAVIQVA